MQNIQINISENQTPYYLQIPTEWKECSQQQLRVIIPYMFAPDKDSFELTKTMIERLNPSQKYPKIMWDCLPGKYLVLVQQTLSKLVQSPITKLAISQLHDPDAQVTYSVPQQAFGDTSTGCFVNATLAGLLLPDIGHEKIPATLAAFAIPTKTKWLRDNVSSWFSWLRQQPAPTSLTPTQTFLFLYLREQYKVLSTLPAFAPVFPLGSTSAAETNEVDGKESKEARVRRQRMEQVNIQRQWLNFVLNFAQIPNNGIGNYDKVMPTQLHVVLMTYAAIITRNTN